MFSFFRKPKQEEPAQKKPVLPAATEKTSPNPAPNAGAETAKGAAEPAAKFAAINEEAVVFETISAEACSVVEEAAVYYANNLAAQALGTLTQYLQDNPDKKEMQPWLMLFDLYQIMNNKPAFNDLSMQFVVKFERSAPVWKEVEKPAPPVKKPEEQQKDLIALGTGLVAGPQLEKLCQLPKAGTNARISVGGIATVEAEACRLATLALQSCRKKGLVIQLEGADHLVDLLKKLIGAGGMEDGDRLCWLLLFEIYEWLGKEAEYEDLAIEYAVTFEISPPAWEAPKPTQTAAQPKPQAAAPAQPHADDAFFLHGVISESSQNQLAQLANFAADKTEVRINMSEVPRVDFVAVGNLMGTLISLTQAGKKVLLFEANELIQALFNVMGMSEFATLMRKKAR